MAAYRVALAASGGPPDLPAAAAPALIALVGVLISVGFGFWQWRKSQAAQRALESAKLEFEREKLAWDRSKLTLDQAAARDRMALQAQLDRRQRRGEAEASARRPWAATV